jgi:hypothetical protein
MIVTIQEQLEFGRLTFCEYLHSFSCSVIYGHDHSGQEHLIRGLKSTFHYFLNLLKCVLRIEPAALYHDDVQVMKHMTDSIGFGRMSIRFFCSTRTSIPVSKCFLQDSGCTVLFTYCMGDEIAISLPRCDITYDTKRLRSYFAPKMGIPELSSIRHKRLPGLPDSLSGIFCQNALLLRSILHISDYPG